MPALQFQPPFEQYEYSAAAPTPLAHLTPTTVYINGLPIEARGVLTPHQVRHFSPPPGYTLVPMEQPFTFLNCQFKITSESASTSVSTSSSAKLLNRPLVADTSLPPNGQHLAVPVQPPIDQPHTNSSLVSSTKSNDSNRQFSGALSFSCSDVQSEPLVHRVTTSSSTTTDTDRCELPSKTPNATAVESETVRILADQSSPLPDDFQAIRCPPSSVSKHPSSPNEPLAAQPSLAEPHTFPHITQAVERMAELARKSRSAKICSTPTPPTANLNSKTLALAHRNLDDLSCSPDDHLPGDQVDPQAATASPTQAHCTPNDHEPHRGTPSIHTATRSNNRQRTIKLPVKATSPIITFDAESSFSASPGRPNAAPFKWLFERTNQIDLPVKMPNSHRLLKSYLQSTGYSRKAPTRCKLSPPFQMPKFYRQRFSCFATTACRLDQLDVMQAEHPPVTHCIGESASRPLNISKINRTHSEIQLATCTGQLITAHHATITAGPQRHANSSVQADSPPKNPVEHRALKSYLKPTRLHAESTYRMPTANQDRGPDVSAHQASNLLILTFLELSLCF